MIESYITSCDCCGRKLCVNIPFVFNGWVGKKSLPCECGAGDVGIAQSVENRDEWVCVFDAVREYIKTDSHPEVLNEK